MNDETWPGRRPRSKKAQQAKRLLLLQTAARMFNERGFENTSLTDIAETLGITKPSLYYYVRNKEAIFLGIFEIAREELLRVKREAQQNHLMGIDQLKAFMTTYINLSTSDLGKCVIGMNSTVLSEESARSLEQTKRQIGSSLQEILRRGVEDGTLATRSPEVAASAIFGAMNWLGYWHKPGKKVDRENITDVYLETFLKGLEAET